IRPAPALNPAGCTKQVDASGLQGTLDGALPGDRICVKGDSNDRIRVTRSGSSGTPIVILGAGESSVKGITIKADHVIVHGFDMTDASAPAMEITGNGVAVLNNTIRGPRGGDGDGIRFFGTDIKILHNTISDARNLGGAHADCMQTFATNTPASMDV